MTFETTSWAGMKDLSAKGCKLYYSVGNAEQNAYDLYTTNNVCYFSTSVEGTEAETSGKEFADDYLENAVQVNCRGDFLAYVSRPVNRHLIPQVEVITGVGKEGHFAWTIVSHHWGDKTTWYQDSLRRGTAEAPIVLTAVDGPGNSYKVWQAAEADRPWVNIRHPKITIQEYNPYQGVYPVMVGAWKKDGTLGFKSDYYVRFFKRTAAGPGAWTELSETADLNDIDYVNGKITLKDGKIATDGTEELGAVFSKVQSSRFVIRPMPGKWWKVRRVEVNKSAGHNFVWGGAVAIFEQWNDPDALYTDPKFMGYRAHYASLAHLHDTAIGSLAIIPAGGGTDEWAPCKWNGFSAGFIQGNNSDAEILRWAFDEDPFKFYSSKHDMLVLYLDEDNPVGAEYCSFTIYAEEDNE